MVWVLITIPLRNTSTTRILSVLCQRTFDVWDIKRSTEEDDLDSTFFVMTHSRWCARAVSYRSQPEHTSVCKKSRVKQVPHDTRAWSTIYRTYHTTHPERSRSWYGDLMCDPIPQTWSRYCRFIPFTNLPAPNDLDRDMEMWLTQPRHTCYIDRTDRTNQIFTCPEISR